MKIKTSELSGAALDWAVAIAKGLTPSDLYLSKTTKDPKMWSLLRRKRDDEGNYTGCFITGQDLLFSWKWVAGGPIIEQNNISVLRYCGEWAAQISGSPMHYADTHLVAAMRCYVASKLGDEVEIPEELT